MKFLILCLITLLFQIPLAHSNGGASALDEMILHHETAINKAKAAKKNDINKDVDRLFDDLIASHEKELKQMSELRNKLFGDIKNRNKDTPILSDEFTQELSRMENEIQSLFKRFQSRMLDSKTVTTTPKIEIKEDSKSYDIKAEVPGIAKEDIKVKVVKNQILIEGKREQEVKRETKDMTTSEFEYGEFKRTISLDKKVDVSSMRVEYKEGILKIHLNKA